MVNRQFQVRFTQLRHCPDVILVELLNPFGELLDSHRVNKDELLIALDQSEFAINFSTIKVRGMTWH